MNQTIFHYADLTHNTLESATSSVAVLNEQFKESIVLVVLQPPPQVGIRDPFSVIVQITTEHGLPVLSAQVVVVQSHPSIPMFVFRKTEMRAISDSTGKATLNLHFPSGAVGCTVFSSHVIRSLSTCLLREDRF